MGNQEPPPQFVPYPRPSPGCDDADRLQALFDGYFGLNRVLCFNVVVAVCGVMCPAFSLRIPIVGAVLVLGFVTVAGCLSYGPCKRLGEGLGWSPRSVILSSVLMGLNSVLCCGAIGCFVLQQLSGKEIAKFGVLARFPGFRGQDVQKRIVELRAAGGRSNG